MKNFKTLLFDGGMGTELYERGFYINRPFEELNITHPDEVTKVHEDYIHAGAQVITTNTFAATFSQLSKFDIKDKCEELIKAALKNANKAVENSKKENIKIALSFGPLGVLVEPLGPFALSSAENEFQKSAEFAMKAMEKNPKEMHFDFFILETFTNLSELQSAINGIRQVNKSIPLIASVSLKSNQEDLQNEFIKKIASREDVQYLGLNCSEGPSDLFNTFSKIKKIFEKNNLKKPLIIQPNAGTPRHVNGRYFYMSSPDYMAKYAKRFLESGASGVGGCCGTRPIHIEAMQSTLKMFSAQSSESESIEIVLNSEKMGDFKVLDRISFLERSDSHVSKVLKKSEKIYSIEILPPKGVQLDKFIKSIDSLVNAKIDFVNIPDGARAMTRVSSLHLASYIEKNYNIHAIPHFTTRDRNLIALQSDLLGAYINGVRDLLLVTGDPPKLGTNREATAVYDIDSIGLTHLVDYLNRGSSPNGESLGQSRTHFGIGVASNPTAINFELEVKRWNYKVENGADFSITQPLFDRDSFLKWRDQIAQNYRPHFIGIWPLISLRNAEFMANEVPGVHLPKWVMTEMEKAGDDKIEAEKRGKEIALKTMDSLRNECEGFCVSAPLGKSEIAIEVIHQMKGKNAL